MELGSVAFSEEENKRISDIYDSHKACLMRLKCIHS